jgi:hypothetical protein
MPPFVAEYVVGSVLSRMARIHDVFLLALALAAPATLPGQTKEESGRFVVRHAGDTVALEQFTRTAGKLEGTLTLRNQKGTSERYSAVIAPDATVPLIEITIREGSDAATAEGRIVQRARVIFREDSVAVDEVGRSGVVTRVFGTEVGAIPYLNLSFALLEQAVRRTRSSAEINQLAFFNLGGGQTLIARLSPLGIDSLKLEIGDVRYHLRIDQQGRVMGGRIPSQDVVVDRN